LPELNLQGTNITTVIWATGYSFDFTVVQLPICDSDRYPIQKRGVTDYPGLYFVGLPWLHSAKSDLAQKIAKQTTAHSETKTEFSEKVVLITGVTSGIGAETARGMAELGAMASSPGAVVTPR
jgi:hypothetical protein